MALNPLNPRQNDALKHVEGPLLVLAGAGSGKTSVITRKIAYLIQTVGYSAKNIAAVTFTNKAAREMKERVVKLLGSQASKGLTVSTFHNLGLNVIRQEYRHLGLKSNFTIFDDIDCMELLKELTHDAIASNKAELMQLQSQISSWKNAMLNAHDALAQAKNRDEQNHAQVYIKYERMLRAYNALDFDDLILLPSLLFKENEEVRQKWQRKIQYLLVDEYQDTNTAQYILVKMIVGDQARFTVVGDDDQSIYSWRGAQPENLALLKDDFPQLRVVKLEQNYRSHGRILKAANQVIANNPHVFEKALWSDKQYGEPLRVIRANDEEHEAQMVTAELITQKNKRKAKYGDFAILYRGNHQARALEKALMNMHVPYKVTGGQSFFSRAEIKDAMAYLRLWVNPDDDNAFLRIVNTPKRDIGPTTLEKLSLFATENNMSMFHACTQPALEQHIKGRGVKALTRFADFMLRTEDDAKRGETIDVIKDAFRDMGYETYLYEIASNPKAAQFRWGNVQELLQWVGSMLEDEKSLEKVVSKLLLRDMMDRQKDDEETDEVQLLTLHASKGLEYPHVFMVGMEEELLPHKSSIESGDIEEERRLTYVGITRARETLIFTMAAKRKRYGEMITCEPSRFLTEIPADDLIWPSRNKALTEDEKREKSMAHIANLKAMLGD
jgi:ATP-dependent DNA helicase Rep